MYLPTPPSWPAVLKSWAFVLLIPNNHWLPDIMEVVITLPMFPGKTASIVLLQKRQQENVISGNRHGNW